MTINIERRNIDKPVMNFNFETQRQYRACALEFALPVHVIQAVRVITQSFRSQHFHMYDNFHTLADYRQKPSRVKLKPYLYLDLDEKPQNKDCLSKT